MLNVVNALHSTVNEEIDNDVKLNEREKLIIKFTPWVVKGINQNNLDAPKCIFVVISVRQFVIILCKL